MRAVDLFASQIVLIGVGLADRIHVSCAGFVEVDAVPGIVFRDLQCLRCFVREVLDDFSTFEYAARQGRDEDGRGTSGDDFASKGFEIGGILSKGDAGVFFLIIVAELRVVSVVLLYHAYILNVPVLLHILCSRSCIL
jgi:hypothetical protein